jgi:hypothetical protein
VKWVRGGRELWGGEVAWSTCGAWSGEVGERRREDQSGLRVREPAGFFSLGFVGGPRVT